MRQGQFGARKAYSYSGAPCDSGLVSSVLKNCFKYLAEAEGCNKLVSGRGFLVVETTYTEPLQTK